jgi:hypothetical protein
MALIKVVVALLLAVLVASEVAGGLLGRAGAMFRVLAPGRSQASDTLAS